MVDPSLVDVNGSTPSSAKQLRTKTFVKITKPTAMEPPTTKLKAGQKAWIMEDNTPTEIDIYRVKVIFEAAASKTDDWCRHEKYMSLRPNYNRTDQKEEWYDVNKIHATKAELLASL